MEKVSILKKFDLIKEHWNPKIVGELNGQQVKLAKVLGEFIWHHHDDEDEAFFVMKGCLRIELRDSVMVLEEGDMLIVPKGVEHRPVAKEEVWLMLFEPASTINTGNVLEDGKKNKDLEWI